MSFPSGAGSAVPRDPASDPNSARPLPVLFESELFRPKEKGYFRQIAKYLMQTEVHTFAFSVAANVILSFFPFVVLLLTLTRQVFHSQAMYEVVLQLLRSYLPAGQDFIVHSVVALTPHRGMKV